MAEGLIYTVNPDGSLSRMAPSAPENEDGMQVLVARYPELISDGDGDLLLIRREQSILDNEFSKGRWSVDHLFVTRKGVPVLVELKRAADTRLRREVIGQMLEYAANAAAYWESGKIAESFAATAIGQGVDPDVILASFISEVDPESFWGQVDANFRAGRFKLVFVADQISRELATIIEFMNDQMRADVRAVELRWFTSSEGHVTLSPRIIGETERSASIKKSRPVLDLLDESEWIEAHFAPLGEDFRTGAERFLEYLGEWRAETKVSSSTLTATVSNANGQRISPFRLWKGKGEMTLLLNSLQAVQQYSGAAAREQLFNQLIEILGPSTSRKVNYSGEMAFKIDGLANTETATKFHKWGSEMMHAINGHTLRPEAALDMQQLS